MNKPYRYLSVLVALILVVLTQSVLAQGFNKKMSIREWLNDQKIFKQEVLKPLDERFSGEPCKDGRINEYYEPLARQFETMKSQFSRLGYLILKELLLTTVAEIAPFYAAITCSATNRWQFIKASLKSKLGYSGNIFALLDISGTLQ